MTLSLGHIIVQISIYVGDLRVLMLEIKITNVFVVVLFIYL